MKSIKMKKPHYDRLTEPKTLDRKLDSDMAINTPPSGRRSCQSLKTSFLRAKSFCSTCTIIVCLIILFLSLLVVAFKPLGKEISVILIESSKPLVHKTNPKYLSVALDSSLIADGFENFNLTNPYLMKLMTPLAPGYLRIGGTMADRLIFVNSTQFMFKSSFITETDAGECIYHDFDCNSLLKPNFTMSDVEWLHLNQLANESGFTILFDLNCLIRFDNGSWNYENAESLISFSNQHNLNVIWELGNEPNSFKHVFNYEVNATQLANDFITLRSILKRYPRYRKSILVGPDITRPRKNHKESEYYLHDFLKNGGSVVDKVSWHQYYFNGRSASSMDFLNPSVFNVLEDQIATIKNILKSVSQEAKPIWLGETSSSYGGGAPGYANRYISVFIWLDKLGLAARNGLDLVVRQSLFKGNYALIDSNLLPRPDWWISVLYKRLVGSGVVPCQIASSRFARFYCHCTRSSSGSNFSSVTIFGFNMKSSDVKVRIEGLTPGDDQINIKVYQYMVTSSLTMFSKYVKLNGDVLNLQPNGDIPSISPEVINSYPYLKMPPYSVVFWVIPSSSLKSC